MTTYRTSRWNAIHMVFDRFDGIGKVPPEKMAVCLLPDDPCVSMMRKVAAWCTAVLAEVDRRQPDKPGNLPGGQNVR